MLEYLFVFILIVIGFLGVKNNPFVRHYQRNKEETEILIKKHNRLLRARKELMNHFDWAVAR
jgi:hypothetical protein